VRARARVVLVGDGPGTHERADDDHGQAHAEPPRVAGVRRELLQPGQGLVVGRDELAVAIEHHQAGPAVLAGRRRLGRGLGVRTYGGRQRLGKTGKQRGLVGRERRAPVFAEEADRRPRGAVHAHDGAKLVAEAVGF